MKLGITALIIVAAGFFAVYGVVTGTSPAEYFNSPMFQGIYGEEIANALEAPVRGFFDGAWIGLLIEDIQKAFDPEWKANFKEADLVTQLQAMSGDLKKP